MKIMSPMITPPTLLERVFRTINYVAIGGIALWVLAAHPTPNPSPLISILTVIWSIFLCTSLPAAVAAAMGRYRWEYLLLPWFGGALALANFNEWLEIHEKPNILPWTLLVLVVVLEMVIRYIQLGRLMAILGKGGPRWSRRGGQSS